MGALAHAHTVSEPRRRRPKEARAILLGLGRIGSAVADLAARQASAPHLDLRIIGALVRNTRDRRGVTAIPLVTEADALLDDDPDVLIEALGGLEPARTIVLNALHRGIPVVTANKTLVAVHGDELFAAAEQRGVAFRCEAAVVAGVPFLGTYAHRPLAAAVDRVTGILNGTSNFILSRVEAGLTLEKALADARRLGFAEPDPSKDLDGTDAAEKLAILIRHFARLSVQPSEIHTASIEGIEPHEMAGARDLGGRLKPVAFADWSRGEVAAYAGPAFLLRSDELAALRGVLNGIRLERRGSEPLHVSGPGAGPDATARTILDDVFEALASHRVPRLSHLPRARVVAPAAMGWYVSLRAAKLPDPVDIADLLAANCVWVRRWGAAHTGGGAETRALLTFPSAYGEIQHALRTVAAAAECGARVCPIVEVHGD